MTLPNKLAIGLDSVIVEKATYHKIFLITTLLESVRVWASRRGAAGMVL
jgi:hypothetical protein